MPVREYFAGSYFEARGKFLENARKSNARLASYGLPKFAGPRGEEIAVDVARIGSGHPRNLLVVISGTHGVEGFCGSGCQVGYFCDRLFEVLPADTGTLLIHALNPYGFAWLRRVDECNVDLNRNFHDFSKPLPASDDYDGVHTMLVPGDWDGPKRREADAALKRFVDERGHRALQVAVAAGQYSHPDGLFFGGKAASWSNQTLRRILADHVSAEVETVAVLDLHTGLGPAGYGEPIYVGPTNGDFERAKAWFGPSVRSTHGGDAVSPQISGSLADAFRLLLPDRQTTYLALEFGTLPMIDVLTALRADNWLHMVAHGQSPLASSIRDQIRAAFYIDTSSWKAAVYGRFADFVLRASRGLGSRKVSA